jgi:hypothetical protein
MKDSLDVSVPSTSILSESPAKNRKRISSVLRELTLPTNPAFLFAPLCVLLPPNWLAQLNLYSTTAAGLALARYISGKIDQGELRWRPSWAQSQSGTVRKIRRHRPYWMGEKDPGSVSTDELSQLALQSQDGQGEGEVDLLVLLRNALRAGGSWWLFPLSQGWLLYTAVFEGDCFPTSYKNVIVSVSTNMASAWSMQFDTDVVPMLPCVALDSIRSNSRIPRPLGRHGQIHPSSFLYPLPLHRVHPIASPTSSLPSSVHSRHRKTVRILLDDFPISKPGTRSGDVRSATPNGTQLCEELRESGRGCGTQCGRAGRRVEWVGDASEVEDGQQEVSPARYL